MCFRPIAKVGSTSMSDNNCPKLIREGIETVRRKLEKKAFRTPKNLRVELKLNQKRAIDWMIDREEEVNGRGGILADEQGTGKTIIIIGLLCVNQAPKDEPRTTFIVCSNKTLVEQWEEEFRKRLKRPHRMSILFHDGTNQARRVSEFSTRDVVITTYVMLATALPKIEKKGQCTGSSGISQGAKKKCFSRMIGFELCLLKLIVSGTSRLINGKLQCA